MNIRQSAAALAKTEAASVADTMLWGTVDESETTVTMDGGSSVPFETTVAVRAGDRVALTIRNGHVIVTGNVTRPPDGITFSKKTFRIGTGRITIPAGSTYADIGFDWAGEDFEMAGAPFVFYAFDGGWTRYAGVSLTTTGTPTRFGFTARAVATSSTTSDRLISFVWLAVVL